MTFFDNYNEILEKKMLSQFNFNSVCCNDKEVKCYKLPLMNMAFTNMEAVISIPVFIAWLT